MCPRSHSLPQRAERAGEWSGMFIHCWMVSPVYSRGLFIYSMVCSLPALSPSTPLSFVSTEHLVARYFSISSLFSVHTFHTVLDQANYLEVSWSSRISCNLVFSLICTNKPTNKNNIFPDKAISTGTWNQQHRLMLNNSASFFLLIFDKIMKLKCQS